MILLAMADGPEKKWRGKRNGDGGKRYLKRQCRKKRRTVKSVLLKKCQKKIRGNNFQQR